MSSQTPNQSPIPIVYAQGGVYGQSKIVRPGYLDPISSPNQVLNTPPNSKMASLFGGVQPRPELTQAELDAYTPIPPPVVAGPQSLPMQGRQAPQPNINEILKAQSMNRGATTDLNPDDPFFLSYAYRKEKPQLNGDIIRQEHTAVPPSRLFEIYLNRDLQ